MTHRNQAPQTIRDAGWLLRCCHRAAAVWLLVGTGCHDTPSSAALPSDAAVTVDGAILDAGGAPDEDAGAPDEDGGVPTDRDGGSDGGTDASTSFAPFEGLDEPGRARPIGHEYVTFGKKLASAGDGSSWLYWRSYSDPTFTTFSDHLDHFDDQGKLLERSPLAQLQPDGFALDGAGVPVAYRSRCGTEQRDVCFTRAEPGLPLSDIVWPGESRMIEIAELDWDGQIVGNVPQTVERAPFVGDVVWADNGFYVLFSQRSYWLARLNADFEPEWALELLPSVFPPDVPLDAPIDELMRANLLARQTATRLVPVEDGVVVAVAAGSGSVRALNARDGLSLASPSDPLCADLVVFWIASDGTRKHTWSAPTDYCESLPELSVLNGHAVISSWVSMDKVPEPNDTKQTDIGLSILELASGTATSRTIDLAEDDLVYAVAPCAERVCLAGMSGARSADTGSTVTFGHGFILPVSLEGELGTMVRLRTPRHAELRLMVSGGSSLLFFATYDGPITHTGDQDRWLAYNRGLLGGLPVAGLEAEGK